MAIQNENARGHKRIPHHLQTTDTEREATAHGLHTRCATQLSGLW
jgi:hypothetical protein